MLQPQPPLPPHHHRTAPTGSNPSNVAIQPRAWNAKDQGAELARQTSGQARFRSRCRGRLPRDRSFPHPPLRQRCPVASDHCQRHDGGIGRPGEESSERTWHDCGRARMPAAARPPRQRATLPPCPPPAPGAVSPKARISIKSPLRNGNPHEETRLVLPNSAECSLEPRRSPPMTEIDPSESGSC